MLTTITAHKGVTPKFVYTTTMAQLTSVPQTNTVYLPTESLSLPMTGPLAMENIPVNI